MNSCQECGAECDDDRRFCDDCRADIDREEEPPSFISQRDDLD